MRPFPRRRTLNEPSSRRPLQSRKRKFEGETATGFPSSKDSNSHSAIQRKAKIRQEDVGVHESDKASAAVFFRPESSSIYQTSSASSALRLVAPNAGPDNTALPKAAKVSRTVSNPDCRPHCALVVVAEGDRSNRDKPARFGGKSANRWWPEEGVAKWHPQSNDHDRPFRISSRQRATLFG